jgi:shikimate kinase
MFSQPTILQNKDLPKTTTFFLVGLMGCGKTHWGQALATNNHFNFIDLDTKIEEKLISSIAQIFTTKGEAFFRGKETELLKLIQQEYGNNKHTIVATGGGTACFHNNINWMNDNGISIWLNDSVENIVERIIPTKHLRPLLNNISNQDLHSYFATQLQERKLFYNQSKYCLNVGEITTTNLQKIMNQYV